MRGLTVDLEDWFQVYNFKDEIDYNSWDKQDSRVVDNTYKILDILGSEHTKATFFVLGWIADKYPTLIKEISLRGHEIACHGYSHKPVFEMTEQEFRDDLDKSIEAIYNACGVKPIGYRAPSFSITKDTLWALDVLKEKGFEYDSSMVNVRHPDYGIKGIPNEPFETNGIMELPIITTMGFPVGGGYFRAYPYLFTKFLLKLNKRAIFYIHPWEFDKNLPKYKLPLLKRFRHYVGLSRTEKKFRQMLKDFRFVKIK